MVCASCDSSSMVEQSCGIPTKCWCTYTTHPRWRCTHVTRPVWQSSHTIHSKWRHVYVTYHSWQSTHLTHPNGRAAQCPTFSMHVGLAHRVLGYLPSPNLFFSIILAFLVIGALSRGIGKFSETGKSPLAMLLGSICHKWLVEPVYSSTFPHLGNQKCNWASWDPAACHHVPA